MLHVLLAFSVFPVFQIFTYIPLILTLKRSIVLQTRTTYKMRVHEPVFQVTISMTPWRRVLENLVVRFS